MNQSEGETPDWEAITHDVTCPLCEYNLRGLTAPRCPECGYTFDWPEVIDRKKRAPELSIEHDPRVLRSFVATLAFSSVPPILWKRIRPTHSVRLGRLRTYWFWSTLLMFAPIALIAVGREIQAWHSALPTAFGRSGSLLPIPVEESELWLGVPGEAMLVWLAWPWVTYASLLIFTQSMSIAAIRKEHVQRCVLYCCDVGWLVGMPITFYLIGLDSNRYYNTIFFSYLPRATVAIAAGSLIFAFVTTLRLASAYNRYLRFPHPISVAIASQLIVFLVFCIIAGTFLR